METITHRKEGGKTYESLVISRRVDGSPITIPVITVEGGGKGPSLGVVGCVHGDEQEGPAAVFRLVERLDPRRLVGRVVFVPVLNLPALEARKRGNPLDDWDYDMNRLYPGGPSGSLTQRTAHAFCEAILSRMDMVVAIHSGGSNIYCVERVILHGDAGMEMGKAMGPRWELIAKGVGERAGIADMVTIAERSGKPGITLELGGVSGRLPETFRQNVTSIVEGIENVMRYFKMVPGEVKRPREWIVTAYEPIRNTQGGILIFEEGCELKKHVKGGTPLVTMVDVFGNVLERITAPYDGIILAVPAQPSLPSGGAQIMSIGKVQEVLT
ncbi:MAG: succinylglutamate desuccinylase/aspartoacylase family protein [Armatimonadetes bacterium]|nr:succinylglutamate desuccinylase/aspartoacylase family protein [Armatimonadota bacterium]